MKMARKLLNTSPLGQSVLRRVMFPKTAKCGRYYLIQGVRTKRYTARRGKTVTRKYCALTLFGYRQKALVHQRKVPRHKGPDKIGKGLGAVVPQQRRCTLIEVHKMI